MKRLPFCCLALSTIFAFVEVLSAYPSSAIRQGNSCTACHALSPDEGGMLGGGEERTNAMSVLSDAVFDPDEGDVTTPADWKDRGALKLFTARPGQTVELTMQVENGALEYAVQLKRFEKEGFSNTGNKLARHFTPDPNWDARGTGDKTYYTHSAQDFDGHDWPIDSDIPVPYTFSLTLARDTPLDLYDLEFATAGRDSNTTYGKWYDDEHFYLNIVPESRGSTCFGLGLSMFCIFVRRRFKKTRGTSGFPVTSTWQHPRRPDAMSDTWRFLRL